MIKVLSAARVLRALYGGGGDRAAAAAFASAQAGWSDRDAIVANLRGAVSATSRSDSALLGQPLSDFLGAAREASLLGRMPLLRRVPPRVRLVTAGDGATAGWRGEAGALVVSRLDLDAEVLDALPVDALICVTAETLKASTSAAEASLSADLVAAVTEATDRALLDPSNVGSAARPASITSAGTVLDSSGSSLAALDADLRTAVEALVAAGSDLSTAAWILDHITAVRMGLARGTGGAPAFPQLGARGGVLCGLPAFTTAALPRAGSPDLGHIVLVDQRSISVIDEDRADLRMSDKGTVELSEAPTGNSVTPTATEVVSLWQAGLAAIAASRYVNWRVRRPGAVVTVRGVTV